ncbi:Ribonucleoside diphosphage reductase 1, beta subunit, B2 [Escherichia coli]|nr:Ribonucleoside diphosphage reductase 1, beta subunit, B2 [Escherichia coli]
MNALSDLHSTELVGLIRHNSVASGNAVIVGMRRERLIRPTHSTELVGLIRHNSVASGRCGVYLMRI